MKALIKNPEKNKKRRLPVALFVLMAFLLSLANAGHSQTSDAEIKQMLHKAKKVYRVNCSSCHGLNGDGEGPAAIALNPKPRSFIRQPFQKGNTFSQVRQNIENGIKGTAMPGFKSVLKQSEINLVTMYIFKLNNLQEIQGIYLAKGRSLYQQSCAACHGDGSGNGERAVTLSPRPLSFFGQVKYGSSEEAIHRIIKDGIEKSDMPGYVDVLTEEEIKSLTTYVKYLYSRKKPE